MLRNIGKSIVKKITKSTVSKAVKWAFWSVIMLYPGTMVATIGISGIAITAATVHSGIVEYGASKLIE